MSAYFDFVAVILAGDIEFRRCHLTLLKMALGKSPAVCKLPISLLQPVSGAMGCRVKMLTDNETERKEYTTV